MAHRMASCHPSANSPRAPVPKPSDPDICHLRRFLLLLWVSQADHEERFEVDDIGLVGQRRRLLGYLQDVDITRYRTLIERLGLRR